MSKETSKKFKNGNVEGTVTFRKSKKRKRTVLPLTKKFLELHPERMHWAEHHKKKEDGEK